MAEDVSMRSQSHSQSQNGEADITQSTQPVSQETQEVVDTTVTTGCWGLLLPSTPGEERVRLLKDQLVYHVGRSAGSHIRLASSRISATHATITWNAQMDKKSAISIRDSSKNGTWLGTRRLKPGETNTLDDKVQIRFGPTRHAPEDPAPSIYVFWDLASQKDAIHEIYDLLDIIGSGNFGTVHKARRRGDATLVAIKHIDPVKRYAGAGGERSGLQEIELLQSARHTNIVRLLEHYDNPDNSLHLVFELVENGDLETYIQHRKADRGLSEEMARHFTHQICAAVAYLHNKNIIHRDLKPANILLTAHEPPIAKVADFGVARLISEFSAAHTVAGTIHYMAPEIVTRTSKEEPYDNKVDSWSVGGILFCMFTTYPPFPVSGDSMQELIAMLQTQGRKAIRWDLLGRRTISPHADEFLKELLVYEAGGRMDLKESNSRSWFKNFQPAYSFDSNGSSLARTASWFDNSASLAEASQKAVAGTAGVLREATVDPEEPAGDAAPAAPSPKPATRARRDSSASSRRSDSKKGAAQAGPSRVPGLRAAPTEPYEEPVAAAPSKGKGKGKARQSPVPAPVSVPLPSSTGAEVPHPDSHDSSMYLYGDPSETAPANPQLSVVMEVEENETAAAAPSRAAKRKRDHKDDIVAQVFGGDSLSAMSTLSSDAFTPQTPPRYPHPVQEPRRTTRASSAVPSGPPPAKRGRTADSKPPSRAPRKPPSTSKPASRATAAASGRGRRASAEPEASGSKPARPTRQKR